MRLMEKESWLLDFNCLPNACDVSILWLVLMVLRVGFIVRLVEQESWLLNFNCLFNIL